MLKYIYINIFVLENKSFLHEHLYSIPAGGGSAPYCCWPIAHQTAVEVNMAAVGHLGRIARLGSSICRNQRLICNRSSQRRGIASCVDRKSQKTNTQLALIYTTDVCYEIKSQCTHKVLLCNTATPTRASFDLGHGKIKIKIRHTAHPVDYDMSL